MPDILTCPDCSSMKHKSSTSFCTRCHGSGKIVDVELSLPALRKIIQALSTKEQEYESRSIMAEIDNNNAMRVYYDIEAGSYAEIRHKLE